uniref:MARVEL domain-containing protein n=1 Tax=Acrobeloides nanus TaxID=290746 RepID=A0A914DUW5_9BILA
MGMEYLRTIHGMITLVQFLIGMAALFTCGVVWYGGDVYWVFFVSNAGGQIIVLFFLFVTWVISFGVLACQLLGKDLLEEMGKVKVIIMHAICAALMLVCAALDTHYTATTASDFNIYNYHIRFVFVMIFSYILLISYLVQIAFVFFQ